jgi:hypothetical protein
VLAVFQIVTESEHHLFKHYSTNSKIIMSDSVVCFSAPSLDRVSKSKRITDCTVQLKIKLSL